MLKDVAGRLLVAAVLASTLALAAVAPAASQETQGTQGTLKVAQESTTRDYPSKAVFAIRATSTANITRVALRYQVDARSCAIATTEVTQPSIPLTPATSVDASWTMDMRKTGGLPPGARIAYQWVVEDSAGARLTTPLRTFTFDDTRYAWSAVSFKQAGLGEVTVHAYGSGNAIAPQLLDAAKSGLVRLRDTARIVPDRPIDIYIYNTSADLQSALIFPQEWTGGVAFAPHNIIVLGISGANLDWGMGATAHELTHIVVGQLAWTCLGQGLPTWLNEGLATYNEGAAGRQRYRDAVQAAIRGDRLLPLRVLAGEFPTDAQQALVAYGESESVVSYLLDKHGAAKMRQVVAAFGEGYTEDESLRRVYGFGLGDLEVAWRRSLGLSAAPAATPTPTEQSTVPTIPPFTLPTGRNTPTPIAAGTPSAAPIPTATPTPTPAPSPTPTVAPTPTPVPASGGCNPSFAPTGPRGATPPLVVGLPLLIVALGAVAYRIRTRR